MLLFINSELCICIVIVIAINGQDIDKPSSMGPYACGPV